ncbi:MAG: sigma-70 family RNA polymerase sigma factor [Clostridia bacterium]|nr:sigma-70 family RNA polymerase sigma factor [Clostridia bacterium]
MWIPVVILQMEDVESKGFMEALYRRNHRLMYRVAWRSGLRSSDAEDAVSQSCLNLIRAIPTLRQMGEREQAGYIAATVRNVARNLHREQRNRREMADGERALGEVPDEGAAVDAEILRRCTLDEVKRGISMLSEDDQMIMTMRFYQNRSSKDIARELGISDGAARSRISRAVKRAFQKIKENEE